MDIKGNADGLPLSSPLTLPGNVAIFLVYRIVLTDGKSTAIAIRTIAISATIMKRLVMSCESSISAHTTLWESRVTLAQKVQAADTAMY